MEVAVGVSVFTLLVVFFACMLTARQRRNSDRDVEQKLVQASLAESDGLPSSHL